MKSSPSFPGRVFFFSFVLALLAFLAGFGIAYQQDAFYIADSGKLAWLHLAYAQELKDDMATIDWSKNLENLGTVRAFQATSNSKTIAQGGNTNYLPPAGPEGVAYLFPSDWSYHEISAKGSPDSLEFTVIFHSWPGPFFWGSFFFLASFVSGCGLGLFSHRVSASFPKAGAAPTERPAPIKPTPAFVSKPALKAAGISLEKNAAYLFIDKNYVIRQVTPEAAKFLQKKVEELQDGHLLDLSPDPSLIQAFEKPGETLIQKPFPDCPEVAVRLKPDSDGCLLVLESSVGFKPL